MEKHLISSAIKYDGAAEVRPHEIVRLKIMRGKSFSVNA